MHIVFTIEDSYAQHLAVLLASLRKNCPREVHCFIVSDFISTSNKRELEKTVAGSDILLSFLIEQSLAQLDVKDYGHFSKASFFRLYLSTILPLSLNKVLYLDSDLIVLKDILALWNTNISEHAIAAVAHPNTERENALTLEKYINSGVLLINLEYWRAHKVQIQFQEIMQSQAGLLSFWDQDVLNIAFKNKILFLEQIWNHSPEQNGKDTAILHFMGFHKPWSIHFKKGRAKSLYYQFLFRTPYFKKDWFKNTKVLLAF